MSAFRLPTRLVLALATLALTSGCGMAGFPDFTGGDAGAGGADATGPGPEVAGTPAGDEPAVFGEPGDGFGTTVSALSHSNVIDRGEARTIDPDDNGRLDDGEVTACEPEFDPSRKSACAEDIELRYRVCMVEEARDASLLVSRDLLDREMCGDYVTDLLCDGTELVQDETRCVQGPYCEAIIADIWEPMVCGWKIVEFAAYTKDGELLERFTEEAIDELGFELLEVPPTIP